jgi:GAF domain-containing protein
MSMIEPQPGSNALADTFARLATELHAAEGIDDTLEAVVQYAVQALGCEYAGVSIVLPNGDAEIAYVTDPIVEQVMRWQITMGEGPMSHALTSSVTVHVADPGTDTRWVLWSRFVAELPIGSALDVPLTTSRASVGVLSLYHDKPNSFDVDDEAIAQILARHAAIAVSNARRELQLTQAMDARKLVGQAMGILMERHGLTGDQAFGVLRRYSQDTNTKLQAAAEAVVATRGLRPATWH